MYVCIWLRIFVVKYSYLITYELQLGVHVQTACIVCELRWLYAYDLVCGA